MSVLLSVFTTMASQLALCGDGGYRTPVPLSYSRNLYAYSLLFSLGQQSLTDLLLLT